MDAHQHYWLLTLLTAASIGVASGVMGSVYVLILTQPDQVLGGWKNFIHDTYDKIFNFNSPNWHKYKWILKPLVDCELCVSGQICLWTYLISFWMAITYGHVVSFFHIFGLIFSICLSILTAWKIARQIQ